MRRREPQRASGTSQIGVRSDSPQPGDLGADGGRCIDVPPVSLPPVHPDEVLSGRTLVPERRVLSMVDEHEPAVRQREAVERVDRSLGAAEQLFSSGRHGLPSRRVPRSQATATISQRVTASASGDAIAPDFNSSDGCDHRSALRPQARGEPRSAGHPPRFPSREDIYQLAHHVGLKKLPKGSNPIPITSDACINRRYSTSGVQSRRDAHPLRAAG